jgi:hypothetical protein
MWIREQLQGDGEYTQHHMTLLRRRY